MTEEVETRPDPAARAQAAAAARVRDPSAVHKPPPPYAGFVTRAIAFAIDGAVILVVAAFVGLVVGLGLSVLKVPDNVVKAFVALGGVAYVCWSFGYFVTFWATTGQTPGDRLMQIRVRRSSEDRPLPPRLAVVRLVGLTMAAIPLGAGFVPILLDDRRRGFQDWLARSVVVHAPRESEAQRPASASSRPEAMASTNAR